MKLDTGVAAGLGSAPGLMEIPARSAIAPQRRAPEAAEPEAWGWLPALSVVGAGGVMLLAIADTAARNSLPWASILFWAGLLVLIMPIALRLISIEPSRRERIGLVTVVGMGLYLLKVLQYPLTFTYHDEFGHWRATDNIVLGGHIFGFNPLSKIYALYPGLIVNAEALVRLGGFSIFGAAIFVLGALRLVFVLALFHFYEQVGWSARLAGLATLFYMTNPNFAFFLAQFAYESYALPLAVLALYLAVRWNREHGGARAGLGVAVAVAIGAVVTGHHMTSYALLVFFLAWAIATAIAGRHVRGGNEGDPGRLTVLTAVAVLLWLIFVAGATASYLSPVLSNAVASLIRLTLHESGGKQLFRSGTGQSDPLINQLLGFGSVALILLVLPFGLWRLWRRYRLNPVALVLAAAALAYPATLALRLTQAGTETSNRASEFLFLGIGFILALAVVEAPEIKVRGFRVVGMIRPRWRAVAFTGLATIIFVGQLIVGWPSIGLLPGPYLVGADQRSIDPESEAAAMWARDVLVAESNIVTDRSNGLLMGSYGRLIPQTGDVEGLAVPSLFFSTTFGPDQRAIIRADNIHYLVVDRRLSRALPVIGYYLAADEPGAYQHTVPISPTALAKFDRVPDIDRIFDSGNIVIYDVSRVAAGQ